MQGAQLTIVSYSVRVKRRFGADCSFLVQDDESLTALVLRILVGAQFAYKTSGFRRLSLVGTSWVA
jgi:hypothetical protein